MANIKISDYEHLTLDQIERRCADYIREKLRGLSPKQAKDQGFSLQTVECRSDPEHSDLSCVTKRERAIAFTIKLKEI